MKRIKFSKNKKGFNTFEFITVIIIITVVLAIAVPIFLRSKITGNESAAITNLHKLAAAFETYRAINGIYPTTFGQLRSIIPPLIDDKFAATGTKQGYDFTIDVVPTYAFRIRAVPTTARVTGVRLFKIGSGTDEVNGVAYYALGGSDPWKPIGYDKPSEQTLCQDGLPPPCINCAGQCCSVCARPGCIDCTKPPIEGGTSCPYVYVYNGRQFVKDNDIIPGSNPREYTDYYKLAKAVNPDKYGNLLFKIDEPLDEKSYLDRIGLLEVIHPEYVSIAPSPEGKIFTFIEEQLKRPVQAIDRKNKDVLKLVSSKEKGNYHAIAGEFIVFDFGPVNKTSDGLRLILRSDFDEAYAAIDPGQRSLHIEVFLDNKAWQDISIIHPHEAWDIWAVDLTRFEDRIKGNIKIKVAWKAEHKLDYVLLDSSKQVPVKINELALLEAKHSNKADVLKMLTVSDNKYAFMKKGDDISLTFVGPKQGLVRKETRDYIFVSEGFYKSLNKHQK